MIIDYAPLGKRIGGMSEEWKLENLIKETMRHTGFKRSVAIAELKKEGKISANGKYVEPRELKRLEKEKKQREIDDEEEVEVD